MKEKGFPLIELFAAIFVLGFIGVIAIPMVNETINNQKEQLYYRQVETIENSAEGWSTKNSNKLKEDGTDVYVNVVTLIDDGYLKNNEIKDPRSNKAMNGCVSISYDSTHNQYVYKYVDSNEDTYQNECSNAY